MNTSDFFAAMNAMTDLADEQILTDATVGPSQHNAKAKILRHGLSISAFSSLEKHLEHLFTEFMLAASSTSVSYRDLPQGFRALMTIDALAGFQTRMGFIERQDRLTFAEAHMGRLTGFLNNPVEFNSFGFSPRGFNRLLKNRGLDAH